VGGSSAEAPRSSPPTEVASETPSARKTIGKVLAGALSKQTRPASQDDNAEQEVQAAINAFQQARDAEAKKRSAAALEKALKKLRQQMKQVDNTP
jgi:hypothetical protein